MSWWDTSQFTSLASNAIKNAQKRIDKALDIPVEDEPAQGKSSPVTLCAVLGRRQTVVNPLHVPPQNIFSD